MFASYKAEHWNKTKIYQSQTIACSHQDPVETKYIIILKKSGHREYRKS